MVQRMRKKGFQNYAVPRLVCKKEQAEEEDTADDMIKKYELFGSDSKGLYMLDNELSSRAYTAPSLTL